MNHSLTLPLKDEDILALKIGDPVLLSGTLLTARDAAHNWLIDTFIPPRPQPLPEEQALRSMLEPLLDHGAIYHCGPLIAGQVKEDGSTTDVRFVSAGPTTSMREEAYAHQIMTHFHVSAVIGKGGMGQKSLAACQRVPAVYLHAVGGAGSLIAATVQRVRAVFKLEFGIPEALWVIEVKDFPAVVTMDAHGHSLHDQVNHISQKRLMNLFNLAEGPATPPLST